MRTVWAHGSGFRVAVVGQDACGMDWAGGGRFIPLLCHPLYWPSQMMPTLPNPTVTCEENVGVRAIRRSSFQK